MVWEKVYRSIFVIVLVWALSILPLHLSVGGSCGELFAQQSDTSDCQLILDKAQNLYYESKFDEAVNLVKSCITGRDLSKNERRQAYKILAQVALAREDEEQAKSTIRHLLKEDPDYKPTIEQDPPSYVQLVESVREEMPVQVQKTKMKAESKGISKWWYYTAGAVVTGTTIMLLNNGDDEKKDEPLPEPPVWGDK